jgi:hypothetical protein
MSTAFTSVPLIDFAKLRDHRLKAVELEKLQDAIFHVGFLYIVNTGLEVSTLTLCVRNIIRPGSSQPSIVFDERSALETARDLCDERQRQEKRRHDQLSRISWIHIPGQ